MSNINNISNVQASNQAQAAQPKNVAAVQHVTNKVASIRADQTAISNRSQTIAQALNTSDVRTDKVASLQQAIASGTYNVSSSDVAGSVIKALQS